MSYNLFLDDERFPTTSLTLISKDYDLYMKSEWTIVRNYKQFVEMINNKGLPNYISFDHDLADTNFDEKTGYSCAKWLTNYCLENKLKLPDFQVHSANPIGRKTKNIKCKIKSNV